MLSRFVAVFALALVLTVSCSDEDDNPIISVTDNVPPAAITDLAASNPTGNSVVLTWTAPGDDSMAAKATEYDIRHSTTFITASNWSSATPLGTPVAPTVGGGDQCDTITGLSSTTKYYFAIRTADEVPNWSGISNVDSMTTYLPGNWAVYTTANSSLPSNAVTDVAFQTATSRYVTTHGGLAVISGTQWYVYTTASSNIASDYLTSVAIDGAGIKWIGSLGGGIIRLAGTTFTNYNEESTLESINSINTIAVANQDDIWFGTPMHGLFNFDNVTWTNYHTGNSDLLSDVIKCLGLDGDGNLWVGYGMGGVGKWDGVYFENFDADGALQYNPVLSIANVGSTMWFSTDIGVYTFNGSNWTSYTTANSGLVSDIVLSLARGTDGDWWFGTSNGLSRFDGSTWTTYNTGNSPLPSNLVNVVKVDPVGDIWIGTSGGLGVFYD